MNPVRSRADSVLAVDFVFKQPSPAEAPKSSSTVQPASSPMQSRKNSNPVACPRCKGSHLRCEGGIPCTRCVREGRSALCVPVTPKPRGRKPLDDHARAVRTQRENSARQTSESICRASFLQGTLRQDRRVSPHDQSNDYENIHPQQGHSAETTAAYQQSAYDTSRIEPYSDQSHAYDPRAHEYAVSTTGSENDLSVQAPGDANVSPRLSISSAPPTDYTPSRESEPGRSTIKSEFGDPRRQGYRDDPQSHGHSVPASTARTFFDAVRDQERPLP